MNAFAASGWLLSAFGAGVVLGVTLPRKRAERPCNKVSNVVLTVLGVFVMFFILVMIITFWKFQTVPDTLIQYTLGAGGVEALALAGIKVSKVCKESGKGESVDE